MCSLPIFLFTNIFGIFLSHGCFLGNSELGRSMLYEGNLSHS